MPKGHYKRTKTKYNGFPLLEIQHDLFNVQVVFQSKGHNPKVWKFLKSQISKEFQGFQEVAEAIMGMSQDELDMLEF
jgi:hypothetical protein